MNVSRSRDDGNVIASNGGTAIQRSEEVLLEFFGFTGTEIIPGADNIASVSVQRYVKASQEG